jgi:hypothetical protein
MFRPVSPRLICLDDPPEALSTTLWGSAISVQPDPRTYATAPDEGSKQLDVFADADGLRGERQRPGGRNSPALDDLELAPADGPSVTRTAGSGRAALGRRSVSVNRHVAGVRARLDDMVREVVTDDPVHGRVAGVRVRVKRVLATRQFDVEVAGVTQGFDGRG